MMRLSLQKSKSAILQISKSATLPKSSFSEKSKSSFHELQPLTKGPSTQNQICDDTSVNIPIPNENPVSQPTDAEDTLSFTELIFCIFILVGLAFVAGFVSTLVLPALLVGYIFTRLLQFIKRGEERENAVLLKLWITLAIYSSLFFLVVVAVILLAIVKSVPQLQLVTIAGLTIAHWIEVYGVVFGIYTAIMFIHGIYYIWLDFTMDYRESGVNVALGITVYRESAVIVALGITEIINCLFFLLGVHEVKKRVPVFSHHKILGLYTYRWIGVSLLILIAYNVIALFTVITVLILRKVFSQKLLIVGDTNNTCTRTAQVAQDLNRTKYLLVYYASGTRHCINFVFSSMVLLLIWVLYFGSCLDETHVAQYVWRFGIWSFTSLFICSLLWMLKTWVLLSWDANSVYDKWKPKILAAGKQLYFLRIIAYKNCHVLLNSVEIDVHDNFEETKWNKDKKLLKKILLMPHQVPSLYDIQQVCLCLMNSTKDLSKDILDILGRLKQCSQVDNSGNVEEYIKHLLNEEWKLFVEEQLNSEISFEQLERWMVKSRNNCLFLANTLKRAKAVVDCLNKFISWSIIAAIITLWLLLTKLASTKALVLISSQLVAAAFIFGETCKTLFQGMIFVYMVHPFDVGDLCLIDDILMEVKKVGLWRTTFLKVPVQEELTYSNMELSKKSCINYKTEFNWNEHVNFDVTSLDNNSITDLKEIIEEHLNCETQKFKPGYNSVEVLAQGSNITIVVNCRHNGSYKDYNYFECYKEKCDLGSELVLFVQNHLSNLKHIREVGSEVSEFKWDEHEKYDVTDFSDEKITDFKEKIEKLLAVELHTESFTPRHNLVKELATRDKIKKLAVNFKHSVNLQKSSYLEYFKEKRRLVHHRVQQLLDQMKRDSEASADSNKKDDGSLKELRFVVW